MQIPHTKTREIHNNRIKKREKGIPEKKGFLH